MAANDSPSTDAKLSKRQRECLLGVAQHLNSYQIADQLGISPFTVDNHIKGALQRLGARSRLDAVRKLSQRDGAPGYPLASRISPIDQPADRGAERCPAPLVAEMSTVSEQPDHTERASLGEDRLDPTNLMRTAVLVVIVTLATALLLIALDPLVQSADRLANAIHTHHR